MARTMKDSGIEWIGEIPSDWKYIKCKYISSFINGYAFDSNDLHSNYIYPVIRIGDIKNGCIDFENCLGINNNDGLEYYKIRNNDILIAMSGATVGKVGFYNTTNTSYINQRVGIIRTPVPKFLFYNLCINQFIEYILLMSNGSAQPNISGTMYGDYYITYPPLTEQQKIADYLDDKCSNIDEITAKIKSTIDEYKKLKQSVITEAVTKGIRPNREMKDSGIEWIGEIPQHWTTIRIGRIFSLRDEKNYKPLVN